ncbi:CBS domain-containing protein [Solimonas sp. SE-A11]|uniref:CBS domain-containing protein n=1 Tax=Solimonas sp. SE-A11 TaxID=3054954 RepID=UPI00259CF5D5|nr:CBS domain-containing protein [Solimonas sp. SE-A11]MDM4771207.1 CBS domain-containing protein [Solimonas sp. SE-A11]
MSQQLASKRVRDYMARNLVTFTPDTEVLSAIHQIVKHRISGAPVVDRDGKLVGMLSEKDCLKMALVAGHEGVPAGLVDDFMSRDPSTVDADDSLLDIASRFVDAPFKRFPVKENDQLVGQISRSDVLRAIDELY